MHGQVELNSVDLRYETCRLRSPKQEKALLASIAERGVEQPLWGVLPSAASGGVVFNQRPILLDGFKRLRCARKLGIHILPFHGIGGDAASGILSLLRTANERSLNLLEQARLVDELKREHRMSVAEIATRLERSKAWVLVRLDALSKMSAVVREEVFSGRFSAYSYLYTVRQSRRLTHAKQSEEDEFVRATAGKNLSTRDIEILARGYFQGGEQIRTQITSGNLGWCLGELKREHRDAEHGAADWGEIERSVMRDLEMAGRAMGRLTLRLNVAGAGKCGFFAEAGLLAGGVLRRLAPFEAEFRRFCDRCGETKSDTDVVRIGNEYPGDRPKASAEP